jgi:hypothetical protein
MSSDNVTIPLFRSNRFLKDLRNRGDDFVNVAMGQCSFNFKHFNRFLYIEKA